MRYKLMYGVANCYYAGAGVYFWDQAGLVSMAYIVVFIWAILMLVYFAGYISLD